MPPLRLVLYTKPGCPLCQGLEEKLQTVLDNATVLPDVHPRLVTASLELRNIETRPEWTAAYAFEVPVLCISGEDGSERPIPRSPPYVTAARLRQHVEKFL